MITNIAKQYKNNLKRGLIFASIVHILIFLALPIPNKAKPREIGKFQNSGLPITQKPTPRYGHLKTYHFPYIEIISDSSAKLKQTP